MQNIAWLTQEAHKIHDWFQALFYLIVTVLLVLSICLEYFKLPMGGTPSFGPLLGRVLIATILLNVYPQVANLLTDLSTAICTHLGNFNDFNHIAEVLAKKARETSRNWVGLKDQITMMVTQVCFWGVYFSIYVAQAFYLFAVVLLYVFSPILCALFVYPQTASATKSLFTSLIQVSCWKPVWSVLATIIWSTGSSGINAEGANVSFLTTICFCLIATGAVLMTPIIVGSLAKGGVSQMAQNLGSIALPGVGTFTAMGLAMGASRMGRNNFNRVLGAGRFATRHLAPGLEKYVQKVPKFNVPTKAPAFVSQPPMPKVRKNLREPTELETGENKVPRKKKNTLKFVSDVKSPEES
jgi:hypothetical protein